MTAVVLGLGSNLGNREQNLAQAEAELAAGGARIIARSSVYETEPVGWREQPWFLNRVLLAETDLPPRQLLERLLAIEKALGRTRRVPQGPRTIDLDILFYGDEVIREPGLEIPHPRLPERRFVLVPLAEIAPDLRHPVLSKAIRELLSACLDSSTVRKTG